MMCFISRLFKVFIHMQCSTVWFFTLVISLITAAILTCECNTSTVNSQQGCNIGVCNAVSN